jgi:transcription termination/antitermination protein NusA
MTFNNNELKEAINFICNEKGLNPDEVIKAIETAIAGAYRKEYGQKDAAYGVKFDVNTGKYAISQLTYVVEEVTNPAQQIAFLEAKLTNPEVHMGDILKKEMDVEKEIEFGRLASQVAKQVLTNSVNSSRHSKIVQQYKDKVGQIVTVEIDYFQKGGYYVKLAQASVFINKDNLLPIDKFKSGSFVKVLIAGMITDTQGNTKVQLSRTHVDFIPALIASEIPEVASGLVTIDHVARDPGFRTKILVSAAEDSNIDPVGTILGRRNMRIINILREINVAMIEKLDVIETQPEDVDLMIIDALEPAQIEKVDIYEDEKRADVYCYKEEAALAVGKRGVNIKLAQELVGYEINLITLDSEGNEIDHNAESNNDSDNQPALEPTIIAE